MTCYNCKGMGWTVELHNGITVSVQRCANCKKYPTNGTARAAFVTQVNDAFDIMRSAVKQWPQVQAGEEIGGIQAANWLVPFIDSLQDVVGYPEETVTCKFCHNPERAGVAHRHDDGYVCENCWDERLRVTE